MSRDAKISVCMSEQPHRLMMRWFKSKEAHLVKLRSCMRREAHLVKVRSRVLRSLSSGGASMSKCHTSWGSDRALYMPSANGVPERKKNKMKCSVANHAGEKGERQYCQ